MAKRKQHHETRFGTAPDTQVWHLNIKLNGRNVEYGTRLKFRGERGEFLFVKYVEHPNGDWIDCFDKNGQWRAIRADRLKQVKNKTAREKHGVNAT